jgi:hypothetical protein
MAQPNWRLYCASRSDLPGSGILSVWLMFQGQLKAALKARCL